MTTLFVARGLLERRGDVLHLTALAREHLVSSSPWFLGPYFPKVGDRQIAIDLLEILRTDRPANYSSRKDTADWHKAMETEAFAEEFIAAMDCRGQLARPGAGQTYRSAKAAAPARHCRRFRDLRLLAGGALPRACGLSAREATS